MVSSTSRPRAVRTVVVDDEPFVLHALRSYLDQSPEIELLSTFSSAAGCLVFLRSVPVEVVVTDVRMPGMDGLELLQHVRELHPETAVVVLTSFDDDTALLGALASQASGFLLKDSAPEEIVRAVTAAATGGTTISPRSASRLVAEHLTLALEPRRDVTEAERSVLSLLCEGYSNAEVASRLSVAESTVKTHVAHLMQKYGVTSRLKLVVAASREAGSGPGR